MDTKGFGDALAFLEDRSKKANINVFVLVVLAVVLGVVGYATSNWYWYIGAGVVVAAALASNGTRRLLVSNTARLRSLIRECVANLPEHEKQERLQNINSGLRDVLENPINQKSYLELIVASEAVIRKYHHP